MTITINVKTNDKELKKQIGLFKRKHLPDATAKAINNVGAKVVNAQRAQIQKRLDRPTPFTIKSVDMPKKFRAKPSDLSALIFVKDIAAKYLKYVYEGGIEKAKKSSILAPVTSAGGERLNKFGNVIGKRSNKADAPKKIFYTNNALWKREGKDNLKLLAVSKPFIKHRKFLDFFKIAIGVVNNNYKKELDRQVRKAIRK